MGNSADGTQVGYFGVPDASPSLPPLICFIHSRTMLDTSPTGLECGVLSAHVLLTTRLYNPALIAIVDVGETHLATACIHTLSSNPWIGIGIKGLTRSLEWMKLLSPERSRYVGRWWMGNLKLEYWRAWYRALKWICARRCWRVKYQRQPWKAWKLDTSGINMSRIWIRYGVRSMMLGISQTHILCYDFHWKEFRECVI